MKRLLCDPKKKKNIWYNHKRKYVFSFCSSLFKNVINIPFIELFYCSFPRENA